MKNLMIVFVLTLAMHGYSQELPVRAAAYIKAYADQHKFSGDVLIAKNGKILFRQGAGYGSIEKKQLNNAVTAFRIGSLTKMFTSALVLNAVQEGKLSLEDPVNKFVGDFPSGDSILVRHLLSHSSGIAGNTPLHPGNLAALVHGFKSSGLQFAPGSRFQYNNFNYILLSYILEQVNRQPLATLMRQKIFKPAGMTYSGIDFAKRVAKHAATGYSLDPSTNQWAAVPDDRIEEASGAGAMYSTTGDLLKWQTFICSGKLVADSLLTLATTPVKADYGLGWIIRDFNGHRMIGHTGAVRGFNAAFMYFPADSITVIYTANFQDINTAQFTKGLYALALSLPYDLPVQKKAIMLDNATLQRYAGVYKIDNGPEIPVEVKDHTLVATAPGGDRITLLPEGEDRFYMEGIENEVRFTRNAGKITTMVLNMGGEIKLVRIK